MSAYRTPPRQLECEPPLPWWRWSLERTIRWWASRPPPPDLTGLDQEIRELQRRALITVGVSLVSVFCAVASAVTSALLAWPK